MNFLRPELIVGALPVTLTNGTTADATQVMSDLNFLVNQLNANAAPLATTALTNANNNFTTVQSGQAATQPANFPTALQIENNVLQTLSSVLGTNTLTAHISAVPLGAYVSGQVFTFIPSNANTGAATLNIDGNGARAILNMGSALSGAELQAYKPAIVSFDGSFNAFDLLNGTPYVRGPNIPAAATLNLDGTFGDYSQVDGIATITAMTLSPGRQKMLEFNSSPLLTKSGSLILPLASNIVPGIGDTAIVRGEAGGVVRMVSYQRASGFPLGGMFGFFESAPQTITGGGTLTLPHGIGRKPILIQVVLKNTTAELNYSVGDELFIQPGVTNFTQNTGVSVVPDSVNLFVTYGASGFSAIEKSNGTAVNLTSTNWQAIFRAWA